MAPRHRELSGCTSNGTPLRRHPKDRVPTDRVSPMHPDGPRQRGLLRSPNTKRDSLGRLDGDRGQGPQNQRSLYRGKSSPKPTVIGLTQNMYFDKDPTERRNCHYLVLFKNPIDRQPIATLGRQIYPGRAQDFLQKFEEVTNDPSCARSWIWNPKNRNGGDYVPTSSRKKHRMTCRPIEPMEDTD